MNRHVRLDEHRAAVARLVGAGRTWSAPLDLHVVGRRLAVDLVAVDDLPRFDCSAMDGYAVHPAAAGQREFAVVGDVPAGSTPGFSLEPGHAARVMTGARLPAGTWAVVPVERTDAARTGPAPTRVRVVGDTVPRANVRRQGEDVSAELTIATVGSEITPALLALARSAGCATALVHAPTRVAVIATGAELVPAGLDAGPGGIHESNSDMVAALAAGVGCAVDRVTTCTDDPVAFRALLDELCASPDVDLVVTTGGVSAGAYEVVRQVCEPLDTFDFVHLAMQPGGPQGLGRHLGTPVMCLPGTPVGAFVAFHVLLRPALEARHGAPTTEAGSAAYRGPVRTVRRGRVQFLTSVLHDDGSVTVPDARHLSALAVATCLVEVPADVDRLCEGDLVTVHHL